MKRLATLLICGMLVFGSSTTVYATSLDDVIESNQTTQEQSQQNNETTNQQSTQQNQQNQTTTSPSVNTSTNFSSELIGATDFNETDPIANSVNAAQKRVAGIIIQVLGYFITVGLSIRLIIDAAYMAIPFSRVWLANGRVAAPPQQQQQGGMGTMGGGFGGGYGSGYGSGFGGGYGSGFGSNSFGGGYGGYGQGGYGQGGMGAMGGMNGMGAQQQQPQGNPFKLQLVSDEAFNAVVQAQTIDPNTGKKGNVFKIYAKDMLVIGIATPILVVLSLTGAMTQLGFLIGGVVVDILTHIGSMF